jgi:hypothetical protein
MVVFFGGLPGLAVSAINMGIPGFGAMYGAASGYGAQASANNLGTAMAAWGGDPNVSGSPALAALMGAFGSTPEGLENAKAFAGNFSNEANLSGYMAAADSSSPIGSLTQAISRYSAWTNQRRDDNGSIWSVGSRYSKRCKCKYGEW